MPFSVWAILLKQVPSNLTILFNLVLGFHYCLLSGYCPPTLSQVVYQFQCCLVDSMTSVASKFFSSSFARVRRIFFFLLNHFCENLILKCFWRSFMFLIEWRNKNTKMKLWASLWLLLKSQKDPMHKDLANVQQIF